MTLVAGVDSSTQGCKITIVDYATGEIARQGKALHPRGTEVHPDRWWDALQESINQAGGLDDVAAISVSGQQHGMVTLDSRGEVVRPALLWNDTRSAPSAANLISEIGGPGVYARRVGIVPVASFTASKLRWLRDTEPENAARVAAVALPHDWLTWRLMGYGPENPNLEALTTDQSDASGTAYWSGETGEYDSELFLHALGRPMRVARGLNHTEKSNNDGNDAVIVPRVLKPHEKSGFCVNGRMIVGPGSGDNAGGALGLGIRAGDVVISLGTSGAVFSSVEQGLGDGDPSGIVAGFSSASGTHLPLVCTLNGARVLEAASHITGLEGDGPNGLVPYALKAPPGSNGLVLLPYFEGERTPNLPTAKASLHNMTLANSNRENIARAYIEGLVCSMAQAMNALTSFTRSGRPNRVLLIGGAAANVAIQEVAATVLDVDVIHIPASGEYVARGAAVQAAWALTGERPNWTLPVEREIVCNNQPEILQSYALILKQAYPHLFQL